MSSKVYPKKDKWQHLANLNYVSGGKVVEVVLSNKPFAICRAKKRELDRTTHYKPYGHLVVVSAQAKDQVNPT